MGIRNSAKAVIIKEEKLLTIKMHENGGTYYILPGGGQEHGENLHQALERECKEELGAEVEIGELLFVREYIGKNHELAAYHSHAHQTEFMFLCNVNQDTFNNGISPDKGQIGTEWLLINELLEYNIFPRALRSHLISYFEKGKVATYIGDIN
ncbi:NUDIX domain-containing protein [Sporosarcina limicola]|uniref:ADP-ribose pyrophosphatase YjhB (NUDIX family) n=1 Tax=Sporosarcina limicola TaxID=34101 RepID=A0A927MH43_9BACL|nr:NUDIX domain-containing protein [Sporosarcina limicola]MBE1553768.1 ADP-ribose pyrophosphatase YjhB (NUDIX family) [Sporosarcina limicola]